MTMRKIVNKPFKVVNTVVNYASAWKCPLHQCKNCGAIWKKGSLRKRIRWQLTLLRDKNIPGFLVSFIDYLRDLL